MVLTFVLSQCFIVKLVTKPILLRKSLKLSFTLNCVLNDFKLTRFAFEVLQKFDDIQLE